MGWRWAAPIALVPGPAALLGLVLAAPAAGPEGAAPADTAGAEAPTARGAVAGWAGSGSCAGRGCHGAVAPAGTEGSEYNTWLARDRHARAYDVLFNPVSVGIQARLGAAAPAHEDARCLSCHGRPAPADLAGAIAAPVELEPNGVGCESCHGPAAAWLDTHYLVGWENLPAAEKARRGMAPLATAAERAETCANCHVGQTIQRQVHHDLIAAGHPRLAFELGLYMARMPRHWQADAAEPTPARTWAVGQAAQLKAALELLAARAAKVAAEDAKEASAIAADPDPASLPHREQPWPEFTEYSCFACHHDLRDANPAGGPPVYADAGLRPGALPWNTWMLPLARALAEDRQQTGLLDHLDALKVQMETPRPDPGPVAATAREAIAELDRWITDLEQEAGGFGRAELRKFLAGLADDPGRFGAATVDWDAAAQLDLALRAYRRAESAGPGTGTDAATRTALDRLARQLAFPVGQDSPGLGAEPSAEGDGATATLRAALEALAAPAGGE